MTFFFPYTSSLHDLTDIETTALRGLCLFFFFSFSYLTLFLDLYFYVMVGSTIGRFLRDPDRSYEDVRVHCQHAIYQMRLYIANRNVEFMTYCKPYFPHNCLGIIFSPYDLVKIRRPGVGVRVLG